MSGLKQLVHEIHRRSLWQVLGIYLAASWVAFEVVSTFTESLQLPDWVPAFALVLLVIFLPVVLATAFVQEGVGSRDGRGETGEDRIEGRERPPSGGRPEDEEAAGLRRYLTWRNVLVIGVLTFALWGVVAAAWVILDGGAVAGSGAEDRKSIAVLPFANMSQDPSNEYFSDGMTDDVITQLSKLGDLKVISRTSTMRYKDTDKSLREIGEELGVATVLEGGVRRAGDEVRVNAQLIDARTDEHLWAETYDRRLTDIFAIQSDLALRIAEALRARLSESERERIATRPTESAEAYELYHRARSLWYERARMDSAVRYYQRALDIDPDFALAYAGLADVYVLYPNYGLGSPGEAYPLVERYARRALAIDSLLGQPRAPLAQTLYMHRHDWEAADREFRRALELSPGYATGHYWYSYHLFRRGRFDEGTARGRRAVELDPRSPAIVAGLGGRLYWARRYEEAEEQLARALELDAGYFGALTWLGLVRISQGRPEEGVSLVERAALGPAGTTTTRAILAYAYAAAGRAEEARSTLGELQAPGRGGYLSPTWVAATRAALGETEAALEVLERAYEERDDWLTNIGVGAWMDPLREEPRFRAVLERIGLS